MSRAYACVSVPSAKSDMRAAARLLASPPTSVFGFAGSATGPRCGGPASVVVVVVNDDDCPDLVIVLLPVTVVSVEVGKRFLDEDWDWDENLSVVWIFFFGMSPDCGEGLRFIIVVRPGQRAR
ncbi:hypothetical protein [Nonomuraea roseoviolacea]|uniref:hypothetical protein n=1 Tax=Nonomuraea roseoviolacea TaxID=103837 RepID=UPI0031D91949